MMSPTGTIIHLELFFKLTHPCHTNKFTFKKNPISKLWIGKQKYKVTVKINTSL